VLTGRTYSDVRAWLVVIYDLPLILTFTLMEVFIQFYIEVSYYFRFSLPKMGIVGDR